MTNSRARLTLSAALIPTVAHANAGIPMLMLAWPILWLAFFPVVAIEAAHLARSLHLPFRDAVRPVAIANLWSTLAGIPLAWAGLLVIEVAAGASVAVLPEQLSNSSALRVAVFPLFVAWIGGSSELEVKAAFVILMATFGGVSAVVELRVLSKRYAEVSPQLLRRTVYMFNAASYALLTAFIVIGFTLTS